MTNKTAASAKALAILLLSLVPCGLLFASEAERHLLPTHPNFDTLPPYGKTYSKVLERLLFPISPWIIQYFQVIGDPPYDTGLTIYKKPNGCFWLMVRQARPEIGNIVVNSFYKRIDLESSIAAVRIKKSNRQIPSEVALEMHNLWLALLVKTRPNNKRDDTYYIHPATVILSAITAQNAVISGKYPPDAAEHAKFKAVEAIVDDLVESCDAHGEERLRLLRTAAKSARDLRISEQGRESLRGHATSFDKAETASSPKAAITPER